LIISVEYIDGVANLEDLQNEGYDEKNDNCCIGHVAHMVVRSSYKIQGIAIGVYDLP
jgi:hypothetical protein